MYNSCQHHPPYPPSEGPPLIVSHAAPTQSSRNRPFLLFNSKEHLGAPTPSSAPYIPLPTSLLTSPRSTKVNTINVERPLRVHSKVPMQTLTVTHMQGTLPIITSSHSHPPLIFKLNLYRIFINPTTPDQRFETKMTRRCQDFDIVCCSNGT